MKLPLLLTNLLLIASPVVAKDVVVVECDVTLYGTFIDAETSNVVDSHKEHDTIVFKIDVANKTLAAFKDTPEPVEIRDGQVIYKDEQDGGTFNMTMKFNPPGELLGTGGEILIQDGKTYNVISRMTGSCKKANE